MKLQPRTVEGDGCAFPVVRLHVRDRYGLVVLQFFRIDTQVNFTTFPIQMARSRGIPFSEGRQRTVGDLVGETITYVDRVRLVIAGREHNWPCQFIRAPPSRDSRQSAPVLGRAGFLEEYDLSMDGKYVIVIRLGPFHRWTRSWVHRIWSTFGMVHPVERPE
jgi:hypothetical protein